ncbi:AT-rich interactive domain-containing protein 5B [Bienertia sinuspersici]
MDLYYACGIFGHYFHGREEKRKMCEQFKDKLNSMKARNKLSFDNFSKGSRKVQGKKSKEKELVVYDNPIS